MTVCLRFTGCEDALRVIIADDERPARAFLASALGRLADVQLVGEASGGAEAVALIERAHPDLALLDLQMPEVDGLSVMRLVKAECLPLVAFVTAYDEYAVRAFEVNAIDYLLKPVEPERLQKTIARARERLETHLAARATGQTEAVTEAVERATQIGYLTRVPVRKRDDIVIIAVEQIVSVIAERDVLLLTASSREQHTIRYKLKDLEARLDPQRFIRVSKSALVQIDAVQRITPLANGAYLLRLTNGQDVQLSRGRAHALRAVLFKL